MRKVRIAKHQTSGNPEFLILFTCGLTRIFFMLLQSKLAEARREKTMGVDLCHFSHVGVDEDNTAGT